MDGVTVIRVVRQVRILRVVQQPAAARLINVPPEPEVHPPRKTNNRFLNAVLLLIIYTIGIGCIVLGATHLNDCVAEKMIPTGLVVFGGLLTVARLLNCVYDCRNVCEEESCEDTPPCLGLLNLLFTLAELGMFIAVCYWTFSVSPTTKPEDHDLKNYCDNGLYKTSFYGCIVGIIFYALPIFCGCCFIACNAS